MNLNFSESNSMTKFNYRDLFIFLVPILIFGLYLFAYKPGVLTAASYSQLHQIATGHFTTVSPIFHTFLEMICLILFKRVGFIGLFQILIFSAMWMIICKYHRDDFSENSNAFVLQFFVTLIICLIPINAVYSVTLSSNVLFSYSIMFLCFLIKVMIDKNGQIDTKFTIILALTISIMSGLNNYGIIIALISLITIIYYLLKKNTHQNTLFHLISIAILFMLLIGSLNFVYDVSDDALNIHTDDAFEDGVNLQDARSQFFSTTNEAPVKGYENTTSSNLGNFKYDIINSFVDLFRENILLDGLFNNPMLYIILSIMLLGFIYITTHNEEILLISVPVFSNTIVMFITGTNNFYSNLLFFYLILIILIGLMFKYNIKPKNIPISTSKSEESTYQSEQKIYEFMEPQEEYNKETYSYIESEIENLTLEDIDKFLGETSNQKPKSTTKQETKNKEQTNQKPKSTTKQETQDSESDLIDQILREMEIENK